MRAAAYLRVSTEEQVREGVSLAAQEERLRAYCTLQGLELVAIVRDEGVSGAKALSARPGGQELLRLITSGTVTHVVALKLDRLFRDAEDALHRTKAWDKANVSLHLVDIGGQAMNTGSAMGRMFLTLMAGFAELERNLIAERTTAALAYKKAHGQVYGAVPFGFQRTGDILISDQAEQATLCQVRAWHSGGWPLRKIAQELTRAQVPTKKGGRWYASTVSYLLANNLYKKGVEHVHA